MSNLTHTNALDSFSGKFSISDHNLISEVLVEYLFEVFYNQIDSKWIGNRKHILAPISLEEINNALNDIWEGPGSIAKVKKYTSTARELRRSGVEDTTSQLSNYKTPTFEDDLKQED